MLDLSEGGFLWWYKEENWGGARGSLRRGELQGDREPHQVSVKNDFPCGLSPGTRPKAVWFGKPGSSLEDPHLASVEPTHQEALGLEIF